MKRVLYKSAVILSSPILTTRFPIPSGLAMTEDILHLFQQLPNFYCQPFFPDFKNILSAPGLHLRLTGLEIVLADRYPDRHADKIGVRKLDSRARLPVVVQDIDSIGPEHLVYRVGLP